MTGSVEFARYKTSAAAGAKLNSALAFSAKAKVGKVRFADVGLDRSKGPFPRPWR